MLTHAQATQVKLAFAAYKGPEQISADLGVPLADVLAVLSRRNSRYARVYPRENVEAIRARGRKHRFANQAITGE